MRYLAEYEGAEPELYDTEDEARAFCDDFARAEAGGGCWDWLPAEEHAGLVQVWVRDLDDAPTGLTGGTVTPVTESGGGLTPVARKPRPVRPGSFLAWMLGGAA